MVNKKVRSHTHKPSDIIETADSKLLAEWRDPENPSMLSRNAIYKYFDTFKINNILVSGVDVGARWLADIFTGDYLNLDAFINNFWNGVDALGKFADYFWSATDVARLKFDTGFVTDVLIDAIEGIEGNKIWLGGIYWLSSMIYGYGGSDPKLKFDKLDIEPYKLPTSARNEVSNGSFEHGNWGGNGVQSDALAHHGKYSLILYPNGSNVYSGYSNLIECRGVSEITVSTYTRVSSYLSGNCRCTVLWYNASEVYTGESDFGCTNGDHDWTQDKQTYDVTSSDRSFARIRFSFQDDNPRGTMLIDEVQVHYGDQIPVFQDFTAYSYNWMPDKLETVSPDDYANLTGDWTTVLMLDDIDLDSTMIIILWGWAYVTATRKIGQGSGNTYVYLRLLVDDTDAYCFCLIGGILDAGDPFAGCYAPHLAISLTKGSHNIKMQARVWNATYNDGTIHAGRRLSLITAYGEGGTS